MNINYKKNRVLQIGSGSMGMRRMRDLSSREDVEIALLEVQVARQQNAIDRFGVICFSDIESALAWGPDTFIISTPPDTHAQYIELALQHGCNFFSELELFPYDFREIERVSQNKQIVAAPSCTLNFLPMLKELQRIVKENLGPLHGYSYCLSTNLASWHPDEGMEYYARNRSTNGTREMVSFELIALSSVFGIPLNAAGILRCGGELGQHIEDTWSIQMLLDNGGIGQMLILGGSPQRVRKGQAIGANGSIEFDVMTGKIISRFPKLGINDTLEFAIDFELVYKDEISTFIDVINGTAKWPYDYRKACTLSGTLAAAEKSAITGCVEKVDPTFLPAQLPDHY